ncbi:MAG: GAF domain-containing sensor histidine kinase [Bacteroidia bacterium]|nr:GAF domain-containing sensor histidine kinase [Bacteroidia bacterium]
MISATLPKNEQERLEALDSYNVLDTLPEEDFDQITKIASFICKTPISLVSLIDESRQWFKSHTGLDATETPRELAFCTHAINTPEDFFQVEDSRVDERFFDNPLVTGDPRVIFYAGMPLVNPDGHALGTLCVIDHKPGKLSDDQVQALKALANQTIHLLELRKRNAELNVRNKELGYKNEELQEFARVAAHDIKSPLSSITMLSEYLLKMHTEDVKPEALNMLNMLNLSSVKLKNLVDGILDYSQNANILNEKKQFIDLQEMIHSTTVLVDCNNDCNFMMPSQQIEIFTNKTALQQVLLNLMVNAMKYNDKDKPEVKVVFDETDSHYHFHIIDNGPGIKAEDQERIFELFEALDGEDRFGNTGTGIGLSTVKKLVEGLGGKITVTSEYANGTTFSFTIQKVSKNIYKDEQLVA